MDSWIDNLKKLEQDLLIEPVKIGVFHDVPLPFFVTHLKMNLN